MPCGLNEHETRRYGEKLVSLSRHGQLDWRGTLSRDLFTHLPVGLIHRNRAAEPRLTER